MATSWFRYDGPGTITDPLAYTQIGGTLCTTGSEICAINAEIQMLGTPQVERPVIDPTFALVIQNAQDLGQPTGSVKLKN